MFCSESRRDARAVAIASADKLNVDVEEVKAEWKMLWQGRIEDKVRAEGMADRSFLLLSVERGTVITASRDFKPLNLKEILRSHNVQNVERAVGPNPLEGGWTKFAKTVLNKQTRAQKFKTEALARVRPKRSGKIMQLKKGGRGWLHQ